MCAGGPSEGKFATFLVLFPLSLHAFYIHVYTYTWLLMYTIYMQMGLHCVCSHAVYVMCGV